MVRGERAGGLARARRSRGRRRRAVLLAARRTSSRCPPRGLGCGADSCRGRPRLAVRTHASVNCVGGSMHGGWLPQCTAPIEYTPRPRSERKPTRTSALT